MESKIAETPSAGVHFDESKSKQIFPLLKILGWNIFVKTLTAGGLVGYSLVKLSSKRMTAPSQGV